MSNSFWKSVGQVARHNTPAPRINTRDGGARIDTEWPAPTAPIDRIFDGLRLLAYCVVIGIFLIAIVIFGIAIPYVF